MKYNDLLTHYFERSNALQWYWTVYVVVIGGLLAFSSLRQRPDTRSVVLVSVLYCFFAYKNLGAIRDVTYQRLAIFNTLRSAPANNGVEAITRANVQQTLTPPDYPGIRNFHVASDLLTVAAIWAMERRRRKWNA